MAFCRNTREGRKGDKGKSWKPISGLGITSRISNYWKYYLGDFYFPRQTLRIIFTPTQSKSAGC